MALWTIPDGERGESRKCQLGGKRDEHAKKAGCESGKCQLGARRGEHAGKAGMTCVLSGELLEFSLELLRSSRDGIQVRVGDAVDDFLLGVVDLATGRTRFRESGPSLIEQPNVSA